MALTEEQKKDYLLKGGIHCPYCGSSDISAGSFDGDGSQSWQHITCGDCNENWTDIYTLTDVEESG